MIEVKHLTKTYGDFTAVDDLSFKIVGGRIYGLLGQNGAGKSTTMNMMTGCLAPTSGSVRINGFDVLTQPLDAKRQIGYLPEQPPLYDDMTPEEYLTFIAEVKGVTPARLSRQVREVMEQTDLVEQKDRLIKHLSKGYCQRVGIAQALLGDPDVIILDEPTVGLDPKQIIEIRGLIRSLVEDGRRTVIISSHILSEMEELCDELLVIAHGRLVAGGTPRELQATAGAGERLRLSVRGEAEGVLAVLAGIEDVKDAERLSDKGEGVTVVSVTPQAGCDVRDAIFFALAEQHYAVLEMEREQQALEQLFLTLTQDEAPVADEPQEPQESNEEKEGTV